MAVIAGAPNIVRGGSHSGNVAAADLVRAGRVDAFATDYVPAALVECAFLCAEQTGISLAEAVSYDHRPPRPHGQPARPRPLECRPARRPGAGAGAPGHAGGDAGLARGDGWRKHEVDLMRVALYYAPGHRRPAACRRGSAWLGRDAEANAPRDNPTWPTCADLARRDHAMPRGYGLHATLKAPMRLRPGVAWDEFIGAADDTGRRHPRPSTCRRCRCRTSMASWPCAKPRRAPPCRRWPICASSAWTTCARR